MILQNMYICSAAGEFQENEPGMIQTPTHQAKQMGLKRGGVNPIRL